MTCRDELIAMLEAESIPYRLTGHPATFTAEEEALAEHLPAQRVAKVVMCLVDDAPVMVVVGADQHVELRAVARASGGAHARLAHEDEFAALFPGCDVGAMPPFGNLYGLAVVVDRVLLREANVTFLAGTHDLSITIPTEAFDRLVNPKVATLGQHAAATGAT